MMTQTIPPEARSRIEDELAAAGDLRTLGSQLAQIGTRLLGASGVCFFPFPGSVSSTADATFFHEQHSTEHMRAETLSFIPVQEREFAVGNASALDRLFKSHHRVVDLNALLGPEGLERKPSFNEYWRPCHIERQLFAPLALGSQPLGYLAVSRSGLQPGFREADKQRLEWLSHHALRALHRLTSAGPRSAAEVLDALRGIPLSCAVFNRAGTLLWLSSAAYAELRVRPIGTHFADVVEHNAALAEWQGAALEVLAQEDSSARRGSLLLRRLSTRSGPLALVISEAEGALRRPDDALQSRWQLTMRESEVLAELAAGRSNKEIAVRVACSVRTVDVHVSSLLRKAGCTSRAELIARILGAR